ncbi:MAG: aromatic ring-hydroxylating dioxygenase subunit alpha [Caulobacteraceae bacterium]|nr:aromatic ring-hydroxylating dioxygenase subunit alpha [Caulobacteraceae bacterium]
MPTQTAPVALYTDPDAYERERRSIFATTWQFLGLASELTRPGDYLAETLAGYPIVAVRGDDGALHGFHNVCRHRAGPLVDDPKGRCDKEFVCRYHAWRYSFDGRLLEATDFGSAPGFNAGDYGLFPVRVEAWCGLVFVNMDMGAKPAAETLAPLQSRLASCAQLSARTHHAHVIECNWKVYVENYLDGHHDDAHRHLHASMTAPADTASDDMRMEGNVALQLVRNDRGVDIGFWAWVWPNLGLSFARGVLLIEHMRPIGAQRMRLHHLHLHEPEDPRVDAAIDAQEQIADEDAEICQRVQENLKAGIFGRGVLSPTHEAAIAWFQDRTGG